MIKLKKIWLIQKYYSKNVIIEGRFLCISLSKFCYNEKGKEGSNSNEPDKRRTYCNILKTFWPCLHHQY